MNESEQASLVGLSFWLHSLVNRPILSGDCSTEENTFMLLQFQVGKSAKIGNERVAAANLRGDLLSRGRQQSSGLITSEKSIRRSLFHPTNAYLFSFFLSSPPSTQYFPFDTRRITKRGVLLLIKYAIKAGRLDRNKESPNLPTSFCFSFLKLKRIGPLSQATRP